MIRIEVYTAHVGDCRDPLRDPAMVVPGVRYYCASDHELESEVWQRIGLPVTDNPTLVARKFKILLHEYATYPDFYVWHDAAFSLNVDPGIFVYPLLRSDLLRMPHPSQVSIEHEARVLAQRKLVEPLAVNRQAARYRKRGFPAEWPMSSSGFIVRRNDSRTARFNRRWYEEVKANGHTRDQMSFDYAMWASGIVPGWLEGVYTSNPYADWNDGTRAHVTRLPGAAA